MRGGGGRVVREAGRGGAESARGCERLDAWASGDGGSRQGRLLLLFCCLCPRQKSRQHATASQGGRGVPAARGRPLKAHNTA